MKLTKLIVQFYAFAGSMYICEYREKQRPLHRKSAMQVLLLGAAAGKPHEMKIAVAGNAKRMAQIKKCEISELHVALKLMAKFAAVSEINLSSMCPRHCQ